MMEEECGQHIAFLDVSVKRQANHQCLPQETHTERYLHFQSHHVPPKEGPSLATLGVQSIKPRVSVSPTTNRRK